METAPALTLAQSLAAVSDALDLATAAPTLCADDIDLLGALAAIPVLRNKLDALAGKTARAAESGSAVNRDGSRNAPIWVGANTNATPKHTRADLRVARWLVDFGEFCEAHEMGVLSRDHLRLLQHADTPITHLALVRDQAVLVDTARSCSFEDFKVAIQYWINLADPDGQLPADQVRDNELSITRRSDGSISFNGQLDPLLGTAFKNAIDAEFEKIATADADADTYPGRRAQRANALANLAAKGAVRDDGTIAAPLINIVLSEQVAEDLVEGLIPHIDADDIDGRCEFLDGTPLHPAFAATLMSRAMFRRIVFDADSRPIDVSVNARLFPRWMKEVALVQTRGNCTEPGCDAPEHWLHADHKHPHSRGGPTALYNVQPYCGPGNYAKGNQLPDHNIQTLIKLRAAALIHDKPAA